MKILYADTDPVSQVNFVNVLKGNNSWSAQYALTNECVRRALREESFDLIIADLCFIEEVIDATQSCPEVAIIAIGEVEDLNQVQGLFSRGVAQYLKKPFYGNSIQKIGQEIVGQKVEVAQTEDIIQPDFGYLDRLTKGRIALKIDLMEIYLNVVDEEVVKMLEALPKRDFKVIGDCAHKMKSNVRMLGMHKLMERLDEVENVVRAEGCNDQFCTLVLSTAELLKKSLLIVEKEIETAKASA